MAASRIAEDKVKVEEKEVAKLKKQKEQSSRKKQCLQKGCGRREETRANEEATGDG